MYSVWCFCILPSHAHGKWRWYTTLWCIGYSVLYTLLKEQCVVVVIVVLWWSYTYIWPCYSLLKILVVPCLKYTSNHIFECSTEGIQQFCSIFFHLHVVMFVCFVLLIILSVYIILLVLLYSVRIMYFVMYGCECMRQQVWISTNNTKKKISSSSHTHKDIHTNARIDRMWATQICVCVCVCDREEIETKTYIVQRYALRIWPLYVHTQYIFDTSAMASPSSCCHSILYLLSVLTACLSSIVT